MKPLKNNLKLIIGIIIGAVLAGGIVYAVISASEISYTREGTDIKNVEAALNDLYARELNNTASKYDVYYIGKLNEGEWNSGTINTTFDIKNVYPDYRSLNIDNFVFKVDYMYDHWDVDCNVMGGNTLIKTYNPETGMLSINNAYRVQGFNSGILGYIFLVPELSNLIPTEN